jgi:hypothetical protein
VKGEIYKKLFVNRSKISDFSVAYGESVLDINGVPYSYTNSILVKRPSLPANHDVLPLLSQNNSSFIKEITPILNYPERITI